MELVVALFGRQPTTALSAEQAASLTPCRVAVCDRPDRLNPALPGSCRMDRHTKVALPGARALGRILFEQLSNELPGMPLSGVALAAIGSSGVDRERFVRGARRRAWAADPTMVVADLMSGTRGAGGWSEMEAWASAIHEAGHALASCEWFPGSLEAVILRAYANESGKTVVRRGGGVLRAVDVRARLSELLAGRAAEDVVLACPSSAVGGGSNSDLAAATLFATLARTSLGLDAATGPVWSGMPTQTSLASMLAAGPTLSAGVRIALDAAYDEAIGLIRRRRSAVEAIARALMARRALDADEVAAILGQHPAAAEGRL